MNILRAVTKSQSQLTYFAKSSLKNLHRIMGEKNSSVLVTSKNVPKEALEMLKQRSQVEIWNDDQPISREELLKRIVGKNGMFCLLTEKIDKEFLDVAGTNLKVIGTMSVGYDHIDLNECKKRNIKVGNTPDVLTDACAELTVALLLATSRRLFEANQSVTNGGWARNPWKPLWMCGTSLKGATVGIVGLGRIGYGVAERLKPFKVSQFLYYGTKPKDEASLLGAKFVSFEQLLKDSDFVIVCCSLNKNTFRLFNETAFNLMKPSAIFINTSRGAIVDHDALVSALSNGKILAAGLDVMDPEPLPLDHPLTKLSNCTLLPHIGSATVETRTGMAVLTAKNILAGLSDEALPCPL